MFLKIVAFSCLITLQQSYGLRMFETATTNPGSCPLTKMKSDFDIQKFMGTWYILEYQYPREMEVTDLSCLKFKFSKGSEAINGNFSFRFPARYGHFYNIPTDSKVLGNGQNSLWMTTFKGVDLLTAIVDTDYDNWAVFVQCSNEESQLKFMSMRVMSRSTDLSPQDWFTVREIIKGGNLESRYKYEIDQTSCQQ